jgi:O-antigen/teichoic acid export membrane protein
MASAGARPPGAAMSVRRRAIPAAISPGGLRRLVERLRLPLVLADQGLVSGATFLSTILLARFLGVEDFGRFTLVWIAVLFVNSLQFSAVMQPMMSIGAKHAESEAPAYYGAVVVQQFAVSILAFLALVAGVAASAAIVPAWGIRSLALPLGIAMFAGQFQDFFRRYLFVRYRPLAALTNDGIRYLGQVVLLYAADRLAGTLTIATALWIMAAAAMLGTAHGMLCLEKLTWNGGVLRKTIERHWRLAKWLVPSTLISWCTGHVFLLTAGVVLGAATVGVLRAAQTIVFGVVQILLIAMDNFAPTQASEIFHRQGRAALSRYLKGLTWKCGSIVLLLLLLIDANAASIARLAYGSQYPAVGYLLLGFSAVNILPLLAKILHVWALAIESTEIEFVSWAAAAAFTAVAAYPFVAFGGIIGVFAGLFVIDVIWTAMMFSRLLNK